MGHVFDKLHGFVGGGLKSLFGIETPEATPPPDPEIAAKEAKLEAEKVARERRKRIKETGFESTIKSSRAGLMGVASGPSTKKTLLGE